jgi:hypothetical protein
MCSDNESTLPPSYPFKKVSALNTTLDFSF